MTASTDNTLVNLQEELSWLAETRLAQNSLNYLNFT